MTRAIVLFVAAAATLGAAAASPPQSAAPPAPAPSASGPASLPSASASASAWAPALVSAQAPAPAPSSSSSASAVLVPDGEPGVRLLVEGRVLAGVGGAPVADAELLLYQTDRTGCYSLNCADERNPGARSARLKGRLRTDAQGRYEFRTVRPGQYPRSGPPAHIHYELTVGQQPMRPFEVIFEGDSRLTPDIRDRAARHDFFILCAPATEADGALRCRGADVIVR